MAAPAHRVASVLADIAEDVGEAAPAAGAAGAARLGLPSSTLARLRSAKALEHDHCDLRLNSLLLRPAVPAAELYDTPEKQLLGMEGRLSTGEKIDYVLVYTLPHEVRARRLWAMPAGGRGADVGRGGGGAAMAGPDQAHAGGHDAGPARRPRAYVPGRAARQGHAVGRGAGMGWPGRA
jgi:hypothetical protein